MAEIVSIDVNSNSKDIKNVLPGHDDLCWFSNGIQCPEISLCLSEAVNSLSIEFQRGFHPQRIKATNLGLVVKMRRDENMAIIRSDLPFKELVIVLEESYDPYSRFCIYDMVA
ncbi:hypothetical protein PAEPH01_1761 [Pancytospora epiphaga]|nr:hypothetical protein PAEPH01_1761 [Pancytospora epiphaga]